MKIGITLGPQHQKIQAGDVGRKISAVRAEPIQVVPDPQKRVGQRIVLGHLNGQRAVVGKERLVFAKTVPE